MTTSLGRNSYGKSRVRLVRVARHPERHDIADLTVDVALEGDFAAAHVDGDNSGMLATDTMRNTVYALARGFDVTDVERFGMRLVEHFLAAGPRVTGARIGLAAHPWERLTAAGGAPHEHAFRRGAGGDRVATVAGSSGGGFEIEAGIDGLVVLKTTGSWPPRSPRGGRTARMTSSSPSPGTRCARSSSRRSATTTARRSSSRCTAWAGRCSRRAPR